MSRVLRNKENKRELEINGKRPTTFQYDMIIINKWQKWFFYLKKKCTFSKKDVERSSFNGRKQKNLWKWLIWINNRVSWWLNTFHVAAPSILLYLIWYLSFLIKTQTFNGIKKNLYPEVAAMKCKFNSSTNSISNQPNEQTKRKICFRWTEVKFLKQNKIETKQFTWWTNKNKNKFNFSNSKRVLFFSSFFFFYFLFVWFKNYFTIFSMHMILVPYHYVQVYMWV